MPTLSSATRSVFVTSPNANDEVFVIAQQVNAQNQLVSGGLTSSVALNQDTSTPVLQNTNILNSEVYTPDILNSTLANPDILNPDILNPDILNPSISNITIANPDILNPDILNPDIPNPDILNPDILNPNILNPDILIPISSTPPSQMRVIRFRTRGMRPPATICSSFRINKHCHRGVTSDGVGYLHDASGQRLPTYNRSSLHSAGE